MTTLYERLGGEEAVELAVDKFYEKVLADERVKHFFAHIDMEKQRQHQKDFLTYAFGGAKDWNGRSMREAHEKLGLNDTHFDAVADDLVATLVELNVSQELVNEVVQVVGSLEHRNDVLNR